MTLRATPNGATMVTLVWSPSVELGGADLTGYQVERSESGTSWPAEPLVANTEEADPDTPQEIRAAYTDASVPKADTRWYYRVSAINSAGTGTMRSTVASVVTHPAVAPEKPTGLTAWEEGQSRVVLHWKAPENTGGTVITGYRIEYSEDDANDPWMDLVANTGNMATTYTDDGSVGDLEADDTRFYRVSAINSAGRSATASESAGATTGPDALQPPTGLTGGPGGPESINLQWTAPASGTGYRVERSENGSTGWETVGEISGLNTGTIEHTDSDSLEPNKRYYYRVSTTTQDRRSRPSSVHNVTTTRPVAPGAPTVLTVTPQGPERIGLSWMEPEETGGADITGYRIEYSNSDETPAANVPADTWMELVANTRNDETEYIDDGSMAELEEDDQRWYRVSAINSAGNGAASDLPVRSIETPDNAQANPGAPTGLMATAMGPERIDLSWTAPTADGGDDITGYNIQYATLNDNGTWTTAFLVSDTDSTDTTFSDDGTDDQYTANEADRRLTAGEIRQYRVAAINSNGSPGTYSTPTNATTGETEVPGAPMMLRATPNGPTMVNLVWAPPVELGGAEGITGYQIERSESSTSWPADPLVADNENADDDDPTTAGIQIMYLDESVPKADTRWYYRVSAINSAGTGTMTSNVASGVTYPAIAPEKPTGLTAWEEGPSRVVLHWKAPENTGGTVITGYKIEYASPDANDANAADDATWDDLVEDTMSMATTYTDDGSVGELEAGDTRFYRVWTINSVGTSANPSNEFSAITGTMAVALTADGPDTASRPENSTGMVATYTASGPGSDIATWSTEGADRGDFRISNDGMLTFASSPNYEMPADADMDNVYMVTVKATSGTNTDTLEVTVTVTNAEDDGVVTLSPMAPSVDAEITATLTDEDGDIIGTTWQWSRSTTIDDGSFTDIDTATSMTYTPVEADDVGYYLRATASYTDGHGSGKTAMENTASMVTVAAADRLLADYDSNDNGVIDRRDVVVAIGRYINGDGTTRADVVALIGRYIGG